MPITYAEAQAKLRKVEWIHGNKARIESGHKAFDAYCTSLSTGNVWGGGQFSNYIRAHNTLTNPIGTPCAPGAMQEFDLQPYIRSHTPRHVLDAVRKLAVDRQVILYEFYHYREHDKVTHGYIVTDSDYRFLESFVTGPTHKSGDVIRYVKPFVSWREEVAA